MCRINTELRDHLVAPAVAFVVPHLNCLLVAHNGIVGTGQNLALHGPKGKRVFALQVLPAKKECFDSPRACLAQCQPGRQVVGLLVDVQDIRLEFIQAMSEFRIVVQMVVTVEADRISAQYVAVRMRALQLDAPGRIVPIRRNNCQQVDIFGLPDQFQFCLVRAHKARLGKQQDAHGILVRPQVERWRESRCVRRGLTTPKLQQSTDCAGDPLFVAG